MKTQAKKWMVESNRLFSENRFNESERNIHMIWFGEPFNEQPPQGTKNAPESYLKNLKLFATENSSYKVLLWTDVNSMHVAKTELPENLEIVNFDKEIAKLIDAEEISLLEKINILRGEPGDEAYNRAAARDIAKALVLFKKGGIYLDTDTSFIKHFPKDLALPNSVCLGTGKDEDFQKYGGQTLSNDVIAAKRGALELKLYLHLINIYMTQEDIDEMKLVYGQNLKLRSARQTFTERFGPKLMRYCVMNALIGGDPENLILKNIKSYSDVEIVRSEKISLGFGKSLSELQGFLGNKDLPGEQYERFMFPRGYTQRGNAHLWLKTIASDAASQESRRRKASSPR